MQSNNKEENLNKININWDKPTYGKLLTNPYK